MNLQEIKSKYPKGYRKLFDWIIQNSITVWEDRYFEERCLYDFFDKQGIILDIKFAFTVEEIWEYAVKEPNGDLITFQVGYITRTEAEESGFMKCFAILEERENDDN